MNEYVNFLGEKKARYYFDLYKSGKRAERKDECLERIKKIDEYVLLLDVIGYLPFDIQKQVETRYDEFLEGLIVFNQ